VFGGFVSGMTASLMGGVLAWCRRCATEVEVQIRREMRGD
jgi:hypothetical protein